MLAHVKADIACYRAEQGRRFLLNSNFWVLLLYRFGSWLYRDCPRVLRPVLKLAYLPAYLFAETVLQMALPPSANIGPGLFMPHPGGVRINPGATLGSGCVVAHNVTIGAGGNTHDAPRIGNGVRIGAGSAIIGGVAVGDGARIAALALVFSNIPAGMSAVGNPARPMPAREKTAAAPSLVA